jgi:anaerobic magnesium-protoporphyrin IX monomethyl ester cyclase
MADIILVDFTQRDAYPYVIHNGFRYLTSFARSRGLAVRILYNAEGLAKRRLDAYYLEEIENEKPLLLGFSPIDESFLRICHFIRKVKKRKIRSRIVLGGFFATLNHERIIRDYDLFDVIVRGEGEETLTEVALTLKQKGSLEKVRGITYRNGVKGIINESRPFIRDLDALPFPATDGYEEAQRKGMRMEQAVISTSRGCYRNCSFCSVRSFHDHDSSRRPWRARSTQHVVDEIETIHRTFGIPFFSLCDDNFIGPGERSGRSKLPTKSSRGV